MVQLHADPAFPSGASITQQQHYPISAQTRHLLDSISTLTFWRASGSSGGNVILAILKTCITAPPPHQREEMHSPRELKEPHIRSTWYWSRSIFILSLTRSKRHDTVRYKEGTSPTHFHGEGYACSFWSQFLLFSL